VALSKKLKFTLVKNCQGKKPDEGTGKIELPTGKVGREGVLKGEKRRTCRQPTHKLGGARH